MVDRGTRRRAAVAGGGAAGAGGRAGTGPAGGGDPRPPAGERRRAGGRRPARAPAGQPDAGAGALLRQQHHRSQRAVRPHHRPAARRRLRHVHRKPDAQRVAAQAVEPGDALRRGGEQPAYAGDGRRRRRDDPGLRVHVARRRARGGQHPGVRPSSRRLRAGGPRRRLHAGGRQQRQGPHRAGAYRHRGAGRRVHPRAVRRGVLRWRGGPALGRASRQSTGVQGEHYARSLRPGGDELDQQRRWWRHGGVAERRGRPVHRSDRRPRGALRVARRGVHLPPPARVAASDAGGERVGGAPDVRAGRLRLRVQRRRGRLRPRSRPRSGGR
ncbi:hypothetical protein B0E53_04785 [Micromonospora sp. MH33]|nr:hypothetical protein B0E53_04785 [Micromonospora sp. MH33]